MRTGSRSIATFPIAFLLVLGCAGGPSLEAILAGAGIPSEGLSDATIVSGLKEALQVGTQNAVSRTSGVDGYFGNPLIRIAMPEQLETMAKGLRAVGFGREVDELELGMNRAAFARSADGLFARSAIGS